MTSAPVPGRVQCVLLCAAAAAVLLSCCCSDSLNEVKCDGVSVCVLLTVPCALLSLCGTGVAGQVAVDCCLQVKSKDVPKRAVVDYSVQVAGQGCAIDALILVTRQRRTLCLPLSQTRLEHFSRHVAELKEHCAKHAYKLYGPGFSLSLSLFLSLQPQRPPAQKSRGPPGNVPTLPISQHALALKETQLEFCL
ncbi:hypothetical protein WMY93_012944 [Mugilogobius chulae]|uniref:Chemokine interleukin-8-like domain-containing protein n=1 Tax=Mugilogobius chulae TaxID=88201 RepID=A0AAW0NYM7_9GOBI